MNTLTNLLLIGTLAVSPVAIEKKEIKQENKLETTIQQTNQNPFKFDEELNKTNIAFGEWYCTASSNHATGWGSSPNIITAKNIAMNECRIRTPWYDVCYDNGCNYY